MTKNGCCFDFCNIQKPVVSVTIENTINRKRQKHGSRFSMVTHNTKHKPITVRLQSTLMKNREGNIIIHFF